MGVLPMRSLFRYRHGTTVLVDPVPTVFPTIEGADIAAVFAGKRIAGDFYDSVRVSPERVLIGLLDVAGPREQNRNIMVAAQEVFRSAGAELFSHRDINESDAMTELNLRINRAIIQMETGVRSCPAFLACYHEKFGTLCYCNAGHTPALLRDGMGVVELKPTGLPLGLFSHATSDSLIVGMEQKSALLLVSRGVVECEGRHNGSSEEYGLERIKQVFLNSRAVGARDLCTSILNSAAEFTRYKPLCDDRTAFAMVRTS
jgi:sigma-B regulation protein RsbU (phosphoserine phosphatase)